MATGKSVWGIDIGQCALKALKLREVNGRFQADAFDIIEHPKILSQPDADSDQLIRTALEQFMARNNVSGSKLVVSVPGTSSFTRFIKLPPVEPKKIPEIVKFEAEQQIPFPINDVIWRWQTFQKADSPDVELGIFAMKKVDVQDALEHFEATDLQVDCVQMAPLALCNFMVMDDQVAPDGATLLADVGVDKTDLVVADGSRIWIRTINLGGSAFTEALVRAFKLPFNKAEKLKRSAASSKYARQIFQAMRPVFADLVQEIQRSIGFYTQLHRETRFKKLIGLGNGFRLPGLQKFLEQNLSIPVVRIDSYNNMQTSDAINEPAFTENVLSFAVAYGLASQGLGAAAVDTNLLPEEVTRKRLWASKRPWFTAAAAMLLAGLGINAYATSVTVEKLERAEQLRQQTEMRINSKESRRRTYRALQPDKEDEEIEFALNLLAYDRYWPNVETLLNTSLNNIAIHQPLYRRITQLQGEMAMVGEDSPRYKQLQQELDQTVAQLKNVPRAQRQLLFLSGQRVLDYVDDISRVDQEDLRRQALSLLSGERVRDDMPWQRRREPVEEDPVSRRGGRGRSRRQQDQEPKQRGFIVAVTGRSPASARTTNDMLSLLDGVTRDVLAKRGIRTVGFHRIEIALDRQGNWRQRFGEQGRQRRDNRVGPGGFDEEFIGDMDGGLGPMMGDQPENNQGQIPYWPDPLFPNDQTENVYNDTGFVVLWAVTVEDDGVPDVEIQDPRDRRGR